MILNQKQNRQAQKAAYKISKACPEITLTELFNACMFLAFELDGSDETLGQHAKSYDELGESCPTIEFRVGRN